MRSTHEQKQAALTLARTGLYYCAEIARALKMRHQTVRDICTRNGVTLPLGFRVWMRAKNKSNTELTGARSV